MRQAKPTLNKRSHQILSRSPCLEAWNALTSINSGGTQKLGSFLRPLFEQAGSITRRKSLDSGFESSNDFKVLSVPQILRKPTNPRTYLPRVSLRRAAKNCGT